MRGHLALSIMKRIEAGKDPTSARLSALKKVGNPTLTRESMRTVWRHAGWTQSRAVVAAGQRNRPLSM